MRLLSAGLAASAAVVSSSIVLADDVVPPLTALDVEGTQALLSEWKLDNVFGEEFRKLRIDGALLAQYEPGDLSESAFPQAHKLHWKQLNKLVSERRSLHQQAEEAAAQKAQRRALAVSADGYSGISIARNSSQITFGEAKDVQIRRVGDGLLEVLGEFLLRPNASADLDASVNVGQALADLQRVARGSAPDGVCLPSCTEFLDRYPNAKSGVYCIQLDADTSMDLFCDMDTMGGGWTYVARGSDSSDGCQTDAFGSVSNDAYVNSRWSLGQDAINQLVSKYKYIEYFITIGHNNDQGYDPHSQYRAFRTETRYGMNLAEPMDSTFNLQVWQGSYWVTVEYDCNVDDCGPCWEPGRQNICCDDTLADCSLASMDQEGQWSHSNTNQHLRCDVSDSDQDQLVMFVRGSNRLGRQCFSSCYQAKQHNPDAASGVYCIIVGGNADNKQDLFCDMETMGGGWTLVARGTNSNDGCDTDAFGTVSADIKLNSRWSLGDWAINEIGYDQGTQWLEYYVTFGYNTDNGYSSHDYHRLLRTPLGKNFTLGAAMDVTYGVEAWSGSGWTAMSQDCASTDCGPCWQPSYQNWCCQMDQSGLMLDCAQAAVNLEGQWSNQNTNQHLRCETSDYDQDQLVLFVR